MLSIFGLELKCSSQLKFRFTFFLSGSADKGIKCMLNVDALKDRGYRTKDCVVDNAHSTALRNGTTTYEQCKLL
jgi:hypothetical protein